MYLRVSAVKQLGRSGLYRVSLAHYTPVRLAACNGSVPCTGYPCPPVHQLPAPADQWPAPCHHQCHPVIRLLSKHLLSDTWATDNRDDELMMSCHHQGAVMWTCSQSPPAAAHSSVTIVCLQKTMIHSSFLVIWWHLRLVSRVWREWEQDRDIISIQRRNLITSLRDDVWQPQCPEKTQFCKYHGVLSPVSHYSFLRRSVNDCREKKSLSLNVSDLYKDFPKLFFVTRKNTLFRINYILSTKLGFEPQLK